MKALPLDRLQLSQWQSAAPRSTPVTAISTSPQLHADVLVTLGRGAFCFEAIGTRSDEKDWVFCFQLMHLHFNKSLFLLRWNIRYNGSREIGLLLKPRSFWATSAAGAIGIELTLLELRRTAARQSTFPLIPSIQTVYFHSQLRTLDYES